MKRSRIVMFIGMIFVLLGVILLSVTSELKKSEASIVSDVRIKQNNPTDLIVTHTYIPVPIEVVELTATTVAGTPTIIPSITPPMIPTPTMSAQASLNARYEVQWSQSNYYQHLFALGDINGDMLSDMGTFDDTGLVHVWFGNANGISPNPSQTAYFRADQGGVIPLCDVNNDHYDDVIITEDKGEGWFVPGSAEGLQFTQRQSIIFGGWSPRAQIANKCFGDVTGDGIDDAVVLTNTQLQVFRGGTDFPSIVSSSSTMCTAKLFVQGICNIGVAGDVNGDNVNDVAVMRTIENERVIELYSGTATQMFDMPPLSVIHGIAEYKNSEFASSFSSVGDINRDGFDDIGVAQYWNGVMVYFGGPNGYTAKPNWIATGFDAGIVASAGDINDDGYDDLYVGSPWQATARIFLSTGATLADTPVWQETNDGHFGWPGGDAGDIDGNGKNDIFVGAHYTNGTEKVFLFR